MRADTIFADTEAVKLNEVCRNGPRIAPRLSEWFMPCPVVLADGSCCRGTIDVEPSGAYQFCYRCGQTWDMRGHPLQITWQPATVLRH